MILIDRTVTLERLSDPVTIIPFGCVHADDPGFREALFQRCLAEHETVPNCYYIGLGDYKNFLRTTARKHLQSYVADDNSFLELDSLVRGETIKFYRQYLKRLDGRLLGLAEGNHLYEFANRTTDTQFLCELAKVPYLGKPCFMRLKIEHAGKTMRVLRILIHHGDWSAGSGRMGGELTAAENKSLGFDFDIYLFSHTHRKYAFQSPTLTIPVVGALKTIERPRVFIRSGAFMAGYDPKCTHSYAHKKLLPPTELGYCKLKIQFYRHYDALRTQRRRDPHRGPSRGAVTNWQYRFTVEL